MVCLNQYSFALNGGSHVKHACTTFYHGTVKKARNQQKNRRCESLFIKAYEYYRKCNADVFIILRIKDNGQTFMLSSGNSRDGKWPPSQEELVGSMVIPPSIKPLLTWYQDNWYPMPIKKTIEDLEDQYQRRATSQRTKIEDQLIGKVKTGLFILEK